MDNIHPEALKAARIKSGWSQKELADKTGISSDQISRWERGKDSGRKTRSHSQEKLTKALRIPWEELTRPPVHDEDLAAFDDALGLVQLNVRVHRNDRNALQLICQRYHLRPADVIKIAPLLFFIIAEKSLIDRQTNLKTIEITMDESIGQLEELSHAAAPHLTTELIFTSSLAENALSSEQDSISRRDIFGKHVQLDNAWKVAEDFFNPFLNHLEGLMADLPDDLVTAYNHGLQNSIEYNFSEQTLQEVIGIAGETEIEQEILTAILEGYIDLGTVLSKKKILAHEEYMNWLQTAVEAAKGRGNAVKQEAFSFAKQIAESVLLKKGVQPVDLHDDDIERLALQIIADNPDAIQEAERRLDSNEKFHEEISKMIQLPEATQTDQNDGGNN